MKRTFAIAVALLSGAVVAAASGQEGQPAGQDQPVVGAPAGGQVFSTGRLVMSEDSWDFGAKLSGEPAETEVKIENGGTGPLKFAIRSSCGCTVARLSNATLLENDEFQYLLGPGQSDSIRISYNTKKNVRNVSQTITITSNDPERPSVPFRVTGEVKQLYDMIDTSGNPSNRIQFGRLERDSKDTRALILKNNLPEPVKLKVKGQPSAAYDVRLEEVKEGMEYRLIVDTKPPLAYGGNMTQIDLETDHPTLKEVKVTVSAFVQPRVALTRSTLGVASSSNAPVKQRLQVRFKADEPLTIKGFEYSHPGIKAEVLPPRTQAAQRAFGGLAMHDIEVTLPPASELPQKGAKLTILTDDKEPEFQKLEVNIVVIPTPRSAVRPIRNTNPAGLEPQAGKQDNPDDGHGEDDGHDHGDDGHDQPKDPE